MEINEIDFAQIRDLIWELEYQASRKNHMEVERIAKQLRLIFAQIEYKKGIKR